MSTKHRFGRPAYSVLLTHGAGATTATASDNENGLIRQVIVTTAAAVDSSATTTVNILDSDGNTVYTKGTLAAGSTTSDLLADGSQIPLVGPFTVQVVFSAAQTTADRTTKVVLLLDRG